MSSETVTVTPEESVTNISLQESTTTVEEKDDVVEVTATTVQNVLEVAEEGVSLAEISVQGPPGPTGLRGVEGPQGPPGELGGDAHFIYNQLAPSDVWTITHNFGKMPNVAIVDSADSAVIGEIEYLNYNQVRVTFTSAFAGKAFLN